MYLTEGLPIKYQVSSFTKENLEKIEDNWDRIKDAFYEAIMLIASFGIRERNLVSKNLILPVALYIYLNYSKNYAISTVKEHVENQKKIQRWFIISTLRNILGYSSDDKLKNIQSIIIENVKCRNTDFPYMKLNEYFNVKSDFSNEEIESLLQSGYATKYSYLILSLLYQGRDWKDKSYNEDHIYPKTLFTESKLRKVGLNDDQIQFALQNFNTIANLELLTEPENKSKNATPFDSWITSRDTTFMQRHSIPSLPIYSLQEFSSFINLRRQLLIKQLKQVVNSEFY